MTCANPSPSPSGIGHNAAGEIALTPTAFLRRTAAVYPHRPALIHGPLRRSWGDTYGRCVRLASALGKAGIRTGDVVAVLAPGIPEAIEVLFASALAGAVHLPLAVEGTTAGAESVAFALADAGARVLFVDRTLVPIARAALAGLAAPPLVIEIEDPLAALPGETLEGPGYEAFLAGGDRETVWSAPADERQPLALCYHPCADGRFRGVLHHHRAVHQAALGAAAMMWPLPPHPIYLGTLPLCEGQAWGLPWAIAAMAGTIVCLRAPDADSVFAALSEHKVTHCAGTAALLRRLVEAGEEERRPLASPPSLLAGGAMLPADLIAAVERLGLAVTHVWGVEEMCGPITVCAWHDIWNGLPPDRRAQFKARQGVALPGIEAVMVADPVTLAPRPADGETVGAVVVRGQGVMLGYRGDPEATAAATAGGWLRTGATGVMHENGYLELRSSLVS